MLVHHLHIAAEVVDEDVTLVLLADDAAVGIKAADTAVAQLRRTVLIPARAELRMFPRTTVLENEIAIARRQFPIILRPCVHIGSKESLEDGILRRQTDISGGRSCFHLYIALNLHIAILVHGDDVTFTIHRRIDLCRTGRVYIKRRITLRDDSATADGERASIDDHAFRCINIDHAVDFQPRSAVVAFEIDALVLRHNFHGMICICLILDIEVRIPLPLITYQMDAVVVRLNRRLAERLQLKRTTVHQNAGGLVAATLSRLRTDIADSGINIQRMPIHMDTAVLSFAPQDTTEIIAAVLVQRLDGIVAELGRKCSVVAEAVGRAAANALLVPILLLTDCTFPVALRNLTSFADIFLDASLSICFEGDILQLLRRR